MVNETQETISEWVKTTFGTGGTNIRLVTRANEEMAELLAKIAIDETHTEAGEEIADVIINLLRLGTRLNLNVQDEINKKMAINRQRKWRVDESGQGYHIK